MDMKNKIEVCFKFLLFQKWLYPLLALFILFIVLLFAPNNGSNCPTTDVRKWIFLILSFTGVLFFVIKTLITTIVHETKKETHAIPIAAYAYMLFSVFFISFFIHETYIYDFPTELSKFINIPKYSFLLNNLFCSTIYMVIIAFVWNFSKSFFTINSLEYGVVQSKPIPKVTEKNMQIIIEVIIRVIGIICFFLAEQHLFNFFNQCDKDCNEINLLCRIDFFAKCTIVLYVSLLIWWIYFNKIINNTKVSESLFNSEHNKWALQFMFGLLLSFFLLYFGIGHFKIGNLYLDDNWNVLLGCILFLVPSSVMCYLLIYIEIGEFKDFLKHCLKIER